MTGQLEKAHVDSNKAISNLKMEIKFIEKQWVKSVVEIK